MDDLYQEHIIDHYKNPRQFGELAVADVTVRESNASCGDMLEVSLKLEETSEKKQVIKDIKFKGIGCAVSIAAASLVSEKIMTEKPSLDQVSDLTIKDVTELLGIEITPTRSKCALLVIRALRKAVEEASK